MIAIDGKKIAKAIRETIKTHVAGMNVKPGLAAILIGADPASHLYVTLKERACAEAGIHFEKHLFFASEPEEKILEKVRELNGRREIHGILIQFPLPGNLNENTIIAAMDPRKDVDGFHPDNQKLFLKGESNIEPVIIKAIMALIHSTGISLAGKSAVIIANSTTFSQPVEASLARQNIRTKVVLYRPDTFTVGALEQADIIITAVGKPKLFSARHAKDGSVIIDIGTTRINAGTEDEPIWKTVGDVDAEGAENKNIFLTPVPGGVGPVTVAMLLESVVKLATQKFQ